MLNYSVSEITPIVKGTLSGNKNIIISELLIDSRATSVSSASLFFAINGKQHNGHRFIHDLYHRGIRAFVIDETITGLVDYPEAAFIMVKNTLESLQLLTGFHRSRFNCAVIAITGSNGKTIVKEWLFHCLSYKYQITRSPKSYNSQVGVPLSLWLLGNNTEMAIVEAGISMPGEMEKLQQIIKPSVGLITNIGEAHQENFSDLEQKISEKLRLFTNCNTLIYCHDHQLIHAVIEKTPELNAVKKFTWSYTGKGHVNITSIRKQAFHTRITYSYNTLETDISIPFTDNASVENALHCLSAMLLFEVDKATIISRLSALPIVAMRLEQKSGINNCTLINDSYNSDLNSLAIALDVLSRQFQNKTKTLILSDILQSGKNNQELYTTVASLVKEKGVTRMIGIGKLISAHSSKFNIPGEFYEDTETFIRKIAPDDFKDEAILLKGSRSFEFEKIASVLEQRKHTTRIEINLQALANNLNYFRSLLMPGTKTMVMVKALSYGSGRHEIAGILEYQRVDYLGVAIADEGVSLRKAGIHLPIMVMNPEPESFDTMIQHKLEPEIYSFEIMDLFSKAVAKNQEVDYPVHIKLDTGMHRLGFLSEETDRLAHEILEHRNIHVCSVFSHLAGSDEEALDDFTHNQIHSFKIASEKIILALGYPVIRHILNTSGIERFPDAQFEMVRLGIGLYGISVVNQNKLKNISTLKSTILQIKPVNPPETVGYNRKGKPARPSVIAIVPVGYADGLNRRLGNGNGCFLVKGKMAPIIGNICMDMTMIDITGIDAHQGDEVVIFGAGNPITDVAAKLGTIPYEVLTGISDRVKRVYFYE
jgi:Alr-MurF fusion protein